MTAPRKALAPVQAVAAASVWMGTVSNAALWREMQELELLTTAGGWQLAALLAVAVSALLVALLSLFAWRRTLKPALIALLLLSAVGACFMLRYRIVIDASMVANVLQTDRHEAAALWSPWLAAGLLLLGGVPALWVARLPIRHAPPRRQALRNAGMVSLALVAATAALLLAFQPLASSMRNHKQLRYLINPLNSLYAVGLQATLPLRRDTRRLEPLGRDARMAAAGPRPPLLVLVVGETGRAGNFGLNGYARDTTPELAREGAVGFRDVWACGTSTAASVPCMFSHLGRDAFESRRFDHENLLDVLQHAGLGVLWIDNQSGCKGVCDRVPHAQTTGFDEVMLDGLDERIAALPAERRARGVVVVLHPMGSHGPAYAERSPAAFKRFLPECSGAELHRCGRDELVNAYDNSIAYADHVLARTIGWLRSRQNAFDGALLYVADHGESLGENNLYLHGLPYGIAPDVQKKVPWITWLGAGFEQRTGLGAGCLRSRAGVRLSHDHLFHSVLGLLGVQTAAYRAPLDAYAACAAR